MGAMVVAREACTRTFAPISRQWGDPTTDCETRARCWGWWRMSNGMKDEKKRLVPRLRFLVGAPHGRDGCGKRSTHFAPVGRSYGGLSSQRGAGCWGW
jgi:hypothetical protein